ncbi:N-acetylmuramoyl-L-alanine amidase [Lysobacter sp. Root690]|uniref:N-acetylmuramoyl-L-alanine amidase n=1 Tax=Lysobacter sp. Root690 TaxID=1736588 RepID=UPI0006F30D53|nr:N-acetylmuramoyl-L-alanine amidase [Lysobacter sp. Root690]KRB11602.1 N-acetylmuramoyl-L-alanine amidase [Lysobacter sp. Root690]
MPPVTFALHRSLRAAALSSILFAAACASVPPHNPLAQWHPSPNFNQRRAQLIVLHHTQQDSVERSLQTLRTRNSQGQVSAHYLIGDDGRIYQLVADDQRAWHAGAGRWGDISDLNSASIGIELDNDGTEPFSDAQIDSLIRLLADLTKRLSIPPYLIVAHGDIAPTRKTDPSVLFPWQRLAQAGYGLWPRAPLSAPPPGFDAWAALRLVGYDLREPGAALASFHRHFRGNEAREWQAGDAEILYDLQRQLLALPEGAPAPLPAPPLR